MESFNEVKPYEQFRLRPKGTVLIKLNNDRYISPDGTHKMGDLRRKVYEN